MNIALVNSWILNGGDAGIIYGTMDAVHEVLPEARITVFAHRAKESSAYYRDVDLAEMLQDRWPRKRWPNRLMGKTFPFRSPLKLLTNSERSFYRDLGRMDAIVYCGGGYLNDLYSNDVLFCIMKDTLALGIKHMGYAQSVGPFYKEASRRTAGRILCSFDAFTARDKDSYDLMNGMGVPRSRLKFTADAAFAMQINRDEDLSPEDRLALNRILDFKNMENGAPLLFMSLREWRFPGRPNAAALSAAYKSELKAFIGQVMKDTDLRICFISTCQGRPIYHFDDAEFARGLTRDFAGLAGKRIHICSHPFLPRSLPFVINKCADLVMSMRMHFIIYSIMGGVPFVALAYERKSMELAKQVGTQSLCHDLANLRAEDLNKSLASAMEQLANLRTTVHDAYLRLRDRSMENARILAGLVG
jgi:colanic acid/amylovoran biosynthesis protein